MKQQIVVRGDFYPSPGLERFGVKSYGYFVKLQTFGDDGSINFESLDPRAFAGRDGAESVGRQLRPDLPVYQVP